MKRRNALTVLAATLVGLVSVTGCKKITQYEVGISENTWTGKVSEEIYGQGLKTAFLRHFHTYPVREVQYPDDGEAESMTALTSDQLRITVEAAFRYQIDPDSAHTIYLTIGNMDKVEQFVQNAYRSGVRDAVAKMTATQILSRTVGGGVDQAIRALLEARLGPRGINITEFFLRDIDPPAKIKQAIEEKLSREQDVETQKYQTQVVTEQANQKRAEAAGIRDAQAIIAESLEGSRGQRYLYWRYLEVLGEIGKGNNNMVIAPTESGIPLFLNQGGGR